MRVTFKSTDKFALLESLGETRWEGQFYNNFVNVHEREAEHASLTEGLISMKKLSSSNNVWNFPITSPLFSIWPIIHVIHAMILQAQNQVLELHLKA